MIHIENEWSQCSRNDLWHCYICYDKNFQKQNETVGNAILVKWFDLVQCLIRQGGADLCTAKCKQQFRVLREKFINLILICLVKKIFGSWADQINPLINLAFRRHAVCRPLLQYLSLYDKLLKIQIWYSNCYFLQKCNWLVKFNNWNYLLLICDNYSKILE